MLQRNLSLFLRKRVESHYGGPPSYKGPIHYLSTVNCIIFILPTVQAQRSAMQYIQAQVVEHILQIYSDIKAISCSGDTVYIGISQHFDNRTLLFKLM